MKDLFANPVCLTHSASTLARVIGIDAPKSAEEGLDWFSDLLIEKMGGYAERTLFFHPDAVAQWLWRKYPDYFQSVMRYAPISLPFGTVMPSVTPVCFATMYSGAMPAIHGIREYRKPILEVDTLFDRMLAAGKKCANVASAGASMGMIFANRGFDAYITQNDEEAYQTTLKLLDEDRYDHISVYFGEYDELMHKNGTEHEISLAKLKEHFDHFDVLAQKANRLWAGKRHLITVQTDHGVHDQADGRGAHGTDDTDDLNIIHFFGAYAR